MNASHAFESGEKILCVGGCLDGQWQTAKLAPMFEEIKTLPIPKVIGDDTVYTPAERECYTLRTIRSDTHEFLLFALVHLQDWQVLEMLIRNYQSKNKAEAPAVA